MTNIKKKYINGGLTRNTKEIKMTNFERIKNMDETELAMFIESIAQDTIRDYRNGFFSKWAISTFETIAWLRSEAKE